MTWLAVVSLTAAVGIATWSLADSALRWLDAYFGDDR